MTQGSYLDSLEAEAISILREVHGSFSRPVILFSGGKDSTCLIHLVKLAFTPAAFPFPLLHIETGEDFPEVIAFRDETARNAGARMLSRSVTDLAAKGELVLKPDQSRNRSQIPVLRQALAEFAFDAVVGGARRDEERARAKERIFSLRGRDGSWNPGGQRAEIWNLFNTTLGPGEHMRVFPLSNWTESDIWQYIKREKLQTAPLYLSHRRLVLECGGLLYDAFEGGTAMQVRARTVGDRRSTTFVRSSAASIDQILSENEALHLSERSTRADDKDSRYAMEERKREGYF